MLVALLSAVIPAWGQTNRTLGNIPTGWTVTAGNVNFTATDNSHEVQIPAGTDVVLTPPNPAKVKSVKLKDPIIYLDTVKHNLTVPDGWVLANTLDVEHYPVKISIAAGATVTLDGVTINGDNLLDFPWAGITCLGDATIILKDGTTNTVKGFYEDFPGIQAGPSGTTLTIQGSTGTLNASSNGFGTGIGGGYNLSCGNIDIQGGNILSIGGYYCAGIGGGGFVGGTGPSCGTITISGGTTTATGGKYGAGIGGGGGENLTDAGPGCGAVTISGGTITATGGQNGAGIGSGGSATVNTSVSSERASCSAVTISGGTITATGGQDGAGIGSGRRADCGDITITSDVTSVTATMGSGSTNCIGAGRYGTCGTVTIGGTVYYQNNAYVGTGSTYLTQSPLIYPAKTAAQATTEDLGKVIGADGRIYADAAAATAAGTTAVALICYVGSDASNAPYNHGLALALTDANDGNKAAYCSSTGYCLTAQYYYTENAITDMAGIANTDTLINHAPDGHVHSAATAARNYNGGAHPSGTSAWFLPSAGQWYKMINACMNVLGANNDHRDLRDGFVTRGGTNLQQNIYRTSTHGHPGFSYCFQFNEGYWTGPNKDVQYYVRSALAF